MPEACMLKESDFTRLDKAAETLGALLRERKEGLCLAESCTAGLIASTLARIGGASQFLWGSYVCYSVEAKVAMLGLDVDEIKRQGTISSPIALAMAEASLNHSKSSWALSVTGLAGPTGDDRQTPIGTVWIGLAYKGKGGSPNLCRAREFLLTGDRNEIRESAAATALEELTHFILTEGSN